MVALMDLAKETGCWSHIATEQRELALNNPVAIGIDLGGPIVVSPVTGAAGAGFATWIPKRGWA
ncbi:MAG: hypothetical protein R2864_04815 [Syntrophotaleaceae bacterium]